MVKYNTYPERYSKELKESHINKKVLPIYV